MSAIQDLLAQHRFFKVFTPGMIATLSGRCALRRGRAGELAACAGDAAGLLVILSGRLQVEVHGTEQAGLVVETLGAGEICGSSWAFPPYRGVFDVRVVADTELLEFDGAALCQLVDTDLPLGHAVLQRMLQTMTERLRSTRLQLAVERRLPSETGERHGLN
jgi:CRP/FNR family transcriptional regulator, cyclic AMP receptor protein